MWPDVAQTTSECGLSNRISISKEIEHQYWWLVCLYILWDIKTWFLCLDVFLFVFPIVHKQMYLWIQHISYHHHHQGVFGSVKHVSRNKYVVFSRSKLMFWTFLSIFILMRTDNPQLSLCSLQSYRSRKHRCDDLNVSFQFEMIVCPQVDRCGTARVWVSLHHVDSELLTELNFSHFIEAEIKLQLRRVAVC